MVTWMEVMNGPWTLDHLATALMEYLSADSNERDTLSPSRRNDHLVPTLGTDYLDS